ncbi:MAG: molybdopterin cofactor-binding domain-containing protein [Granulosicoccus sp.]
MGVTRRFFMVSGAAIGGGLLLGVGGLGAHLQTHDRLGTQRKGNDGEDSAQVNLWIRISPDNRIIVINPHTDMGQGSGTGLLQIVADELDADWLQMRIEQAPADPAYSNGKVFEGFVREMHTPPEWASTLLENGFYRLGDLMKMQMTGGSSAVRFTGWDAMRKAAAATRQMLLTAAAEKLDAPIDALTTELGTVLHTISGKSFTYGELATEASLLASPENVSLKALNQYRFVGQSVARVDIPAKVFSNTDYGIDAVVPGMQYAAVATSGVFGAQVISIDNLADVKSARGVSDVLIVPDGVAVVADNPWRAEKAVRAVTFTREPHENDTLNTESLVAAQRKALSGSLTSAMSIGKPDEQDAAVTAEYLVPYLAHSTLEPMNATVWQENGKLHIICGVQNPLLAKSRAAKEAGLALDDVVLHTRQMGGGFGRRVAFSMSGDEPLNWLVQAVRIAVDSGKPVKTTWSRETDTRSDMYRPMVMAQFAGALGDDGKPSLWRSRSYGKEMNIKAVAPAYQIPHVAISFVDQPHPVPTGFWRSVEHSQHGFFIESFIDELASNAGADPLTYRKSLLVQNSPAFKVLEKVAEMSGWRNGVDNRGRAMGVAMVQSFGSTVAQVVEASITPNGPAAHRVWCAVDCGVAVNPQAIEAQVQGSVSYALSAALYGKCDLKDGGVVQSNFHDYKLVGMAQAPRVEVELLKLGSQVGGVGEIGVPPLAPALCNALAVLDGDRRRSLPLV